MAYRQQTGDDLPVDRGVFVTEIIPDSPAERIQLQPGDIITEISGKKVEDISALAQRIREAGFGARIQITVYRSGKSDPQQDSGDTALKQLTLTLLGRLLCI